MLSAIFLFIHITQIYHKFSLDCVLPNEPARLTSQYSHADLSDDELPTFGRITVDGHPAEYYRRESTMVLAFLKFIVHFNTIPLLGTHRRPRREEYQTDRKGVENTIVAIVWHFSDFYPG